MARIIKSRKAIPVTDLYENLNNIKQAIADTSDGVKSQAGEMITDLLESLKTKGNDYQEEIEEFVADKPFKSLALALLAGILIGKVVL